MTRRLWCALAASVLTLGAVGCASPRTLDPRTARFPAPEFHPPVLAEATLSGGAPVFLLEDHDVPLVRVYLSFRGGACTTRRRRPGSPR